jgi:hypothetical protein
MLYKTANFCGCAHSEPVDIGFKLRIFQEKRSVLNVHELRTGFDAEKPIKSYVNGL